MGMNENAQEFLSANQVSFGLLGWAAWVDFSRGLKLCLSTNSPRICAPEASGGSTEEVGAANPEPGSSGGCPWYGERDALACRAGAVVYHRSPA